MRNSFFAWTGRGSVLGAPIRARCERLLHRGAPRKYGAQASISAGKPYYVTTPIFYVNAGTILTTPRLADC